MTRAFALPQVVDGRQRRAYAVVVADLPVFHGDVEVHAYQHPKALNVDVSQGLLGHRSPQFAGFLRTPD